MKRVILTNVMTGERVAVHTTTAHPDSSYGQAVWVDDNEQAYLQEGMEGRNPFYQITDIEEVPDEEQV